jgi:hydroxypyruvate isomerase
MQRRSFLHCCATLGLASLAPLGTLPLVGTQPAFKLKYAPHPGMFKNKGGEDYLDQIKFAADQGFTAWEDNRIGDQSVEMQTKIGQELTKLGMTMGVFVAYGSIDKPVFVRKNEEVWAAILKQLTDSVDIAKRVGAKWVTVVPGSIDQQHVEDPKWNKGGGPRLADGFQFANVVELLRRASEILEAFELTMVLEPLNWHANHGGAYLRYSDQAYAICKAVNSPSCKILYDIYHQQISEGNLISNINACWDEIAYFQSGDNPGRKEPGTGEINYRNIFQHLHDKGYNGVIGMEHGNAGKGADGEQAVISAYRAVDVIGN